MAIVSADTLQLGIVAEVTPGVTPVSPAFQLIRASSESLAFTPIASASTELTGPGGRCKRPADVTGQTIAGAISFELAPAAWVDLMIQGVLGARWGECPLTGAAGGAIGATEIAVGDELMTFTIEKRYPDPASPGSYFYQWYRGVTLSALTINITPNDRVTGSVTIIGGEPDLGEGTDALPGIAGATYISAGESAVFTAPNVTKLDVGSDIMIGTSCWTSATILLDSSNRGIPCIGSVGDREVVLGTLAASLSGEVYFKDQTVLQAMLDNQTVGDVTIVLENGDGDILRFDLFDARPVDGSVTTPGTGQDIQQSLTLEPSGSTVCDDGTNSWSSCVVISKQDAAPVLPLRLFSDDLTDGQLLSAD